MRYLFPFAVVLCAGALIASDRKLPIEESSNDLVEITAQLLDADQVKSELGKPLDGIVVVRVKVRPLTEKPVHIDLDDFLLISGKDGQRAQPFAPTEIAGSTSLVVTPTGARGGINGNRGWGGFGGVGLGGGGGMGNSTATNTGGVQVKSQTTDKNENPLLPVLREKVLPQKDVTDPVTGLLYFGMEGKLKPKDLEMYYKTPSGKLGLRFHP